MHVSYFRREWPLALKCCLLWQFLCLAMASESGSMSSSSTEENSRCQETLPSQLGAPVACSLGNSMLQLASKNSRTRTVDENALEENSTQNTSMSTTATNHSGGVAVAAIQANASVPPGPVSTGTQGQLASEMSLPFAATATEAEAVATGTSVRMILLEAEQSTRHYLQKTYKTGSVISISIFALICLLGLFYSVHDLSSSV